MIKTDLIMELTKNFQDFRINKLSNEDIDVIKVIIDDNNYNEYKKKKGIYYNIATNIIKDEIVEKENDLINTFIVLLKDIFKIYKIKKKSKILFVGLGNENITPDSLGPKTIKKIIMTNHLDKKNLPKIASIIPGVMATTGLESSNIINSVVKDFKPDILLCIDSLAARSMKRLNSVIQITTSGITPGSGVGNNRKEISYETIKIPVIALGIPTVVGIENISLDILEFLKLKNKKNELIKEIFDNNLNMYVTSKMIDYYIEKMSDIIAKSFNDYLISTNI